MTHRTLRPICNSETCTKGLLVVGHGFLCLQLCPWMHHVPTTGDQHPSNCPSTHVHTSKERCLTLRNGYDRLHHGPTTIHWLVGQDLWCSYGHGRPWHYKRGNSFPLYEDHRCHDNGNSLLRRCFQTIWCTVLHYLWLWSSIFLQSLSRISQTLQPQVVHEHSLPPTNWWRNWTDESGHQSIPLDLLWKQTQWMDQLHHRHGVRSQPARGTRTQCIPILSHDGLQPLSHSHCHPTNKCTCSRRMSWQPSASSAGSRGCSRTRTTMDGGMNHQGLHPLQRRPTGLIGL